MTAFTPATCPHRDRHGTTPSGCPYCGFDPLVREEVLATRMSTIREPAKNPCGSCPYRRDVPSGVWDQGEYAKLPLYDADTFAQPFGVFSCHQQDGRVCAGWAGCHDMEENMAIRVAVSSERMTVEVFEAIRDYTTEVPLFESGQAAADHGLAEVEDPGPKARTKIERLTQRLKP